MTFPLCITIAVVPIMALSTSGSLGTTKSRKLKPLRERSLISLHTRVFQYETLLAFMYYRPLIVFEKAPVGGYYSTGNSTLLTQLPLHELENFQLAGHTTLERTPLEGNPLETRTALNAHR